MTRKDYEAIALALARSRPRFLENSPYNDGEWAAWSDTRRELMFVLAKDNPHFDVEKFRVATMENIG